MGEDIRHRARPRRRTRPGTADNRLICDLDALAMRLMGNLAPRSGGAAGTLSNKGSTPSGSGLVEQALDAAQDVESFLTEQSARIAYLENLIHTDELTGLRNRRGFFELLRRTLAGAKRYGDQGVLVICDLDNFKAVNDTHGHHVGDVVLRQVAQVLEKQVRELDLVARLGGDEFAILMVQTNWQDGLKRAKSVDRAVNRTIVTHQGLRIPVSASIGVEPFGPHDEEGKLIARADIAMYANKRKKAAGLIAAAE